LKGDRRRYLKSRTIFGKEVYREEEREIFKSMRQLL